MKLTVAYITGRDEPMLRWAVDGLVAQARPDDDIHLVVVDAKTSRYPADALCHDVTAFPFASARVVSPKPTIWQGRHRVTREDWWAMSNARNTALCLCGTEWIAFLDDRCKLGPSWLDAVRRMAISPGPHVLCGTYEKWSGLGTSVATGAPKLLAVDNRYKETGGAPNVDCGGQWLYGCTFALPLEWALAVNGFEEGCDGLSAEDYIFGMNLANAGYKLTFDPTMKVLQDRSPGHENRYRREDKGVSPNDKSHAALARFGGRSRTEFTPDLRAIRAEVLAGGKFPIPDPAGDHRDWYDGTPIRGL